MHLSRKPVRKCNGCGLNFRDQCGVFDNPHEQWERRARCVGYKNQKLLDEYLADVAARQADAKKEKRKEVAKLRQTEEHHEGDRHVLMATRH